MQGSTVSTLLLVLANDLPPFAGRTFDDFALARAAHVLALVHWIGGVAVVTTIILPRAAKLPSAELAITEFEVFERRFASRVIPTVWIKIVVL
jgi:uncharacterized membrane protein